MPAFKPATRLSWAAAIRRPITASSIRRWTTPRPCSIRRPRTIAPAARRYIYGRRGTPTSEALESALAELEGPHCAGVALLPSGLAAITTALLSVARCRRPRAGHRQRLSADPEILRQRAHPLWRRDHLLRPADRRRHRRTDAAQYARGLRGGAGLAVVRGAGRPRDRGCRARPRRRRADGQYLGEPALFPRARQGRRPLDPGRAPNISAAIPT